MCLVLYCRVLCLAFFLSCSVLLLVHPLVYPLVYLYLYSDATADNELSTYCISGKPVELFVHCCGPNAQATPPKGVVAKCVLYYIVESFALPFSSLVVCFCLYTPWYTPLYTSTCTLMQLLTMNYQPIAYQANLLSCLSTAVGLMHKPPLQKGW